jgi:hypothetical protein
MRAIHRACGPFLFLNRKSRIGDLTIEIRDP